MNRCHLNGSTQNIRKEYLESSLFVFSSRFEGFGMVLIEAMACGLPVVSFDCPCGPKDIVFHDEDGLLVPSGDIDKLADELSVVMSNESLIRKMSKTAVIHSKRFRLDRISLRWKLLFDRLITR